MTTAIAFTGKGKRSKPLSQAEKTVVAQAIRKVARRTPNVDLFYSGAQVNVDVWAAECAIRYFPEAHHVIIIPRWQPSLTDARTEECAYDRQAVRQLKELAYEQSVRLTISLAPPGLESRGKGYLRRDDVLAQNCTHMMAFPEQPHEIKRSGTWATVRKALAQGRRVLVTPLNGSKPYVRAS